ncbi:PIG-L family deacetylase [Luedemannella helvata]|uniref:PIG-L family deacetylase n=1 Tax=Luedemannella helvata TaxID=349315 RepID=A0ABP4X1H1_9ACTN
MSGLMVFSTHLDDAVLSAGEVIAAHPGAVVVTVFAGLPATGTRGRYDAATGLGDGHRAMSSRRDEDTAALATLGAYPVHLDFLDRQYRHPSSDEEIAERLRSLVTAHRPTTVLGPVGLVHPDHRQVGRVWPAVAAGTDTLAYEDMPYRRQFPATDDAVRAFVAAHGATAHPPTGGDRAAKERAIGAYVSQLATVLPELCLGPEQLWRLPARP